MKSIDKFVLVLVASLALLLAGCGGGSSSTEPAPEPELTAYEMALASINSASTAEDAQAAYDDVKEQVTAAEGEKLEQAVANRTTALQEMADEMAQKDGLKMAADAIDTSDLSTAENIQAAKAAIAGLQAALDEADDVSDADKGMYQSQLDAAQLAVDMTEQQMALDDAHTALGAAVAALAGDATQAEIDVAKGAVTKLQGAIDAAKDVSDTSMYEDAVADAAAPIAEAEKVVMAEAAAAQKAAEEKAAMEAAERAKEMAALGKALYAALGGSGTPDTGNALNNLESNPGFMNGKLTIDAAEGAGSLANAAANAMVSLEAGDSAGSLSGWMGMDYAKVEGKDENKVTNMARVYTNQDAPKSVPFADEYPGLTTDGEDGVTKGMVVVNTSNAGKVMAAPFEHSGEQNHAIPDNAVALKFRGTFDGAPGEYRCTGTCTSTNDGTDSSPDGLNASGTWHFKPDAGAMVSKPDEHYLYYGWWVRKDDEDMPTAASAFAGRAGTDNGTDSLDMAGDLTAITGSASYAGHAAGKFAMSNVLDGTGDGGHFTADAELNATFGGGATAGVTGTIDNFRLNDGSEDPGWSVSLAKGGLGSSGEIMAPDADQTVWSINGNKAPASGTWSGMMYDEMPGNAPDGDGSNIPTTATGTFYSAFSSIGRMVGAFAVEKE